MERVALNRIPDNGRVGCDVDVWQRVARVAEQSRVTRSSQCHSMGQGSAGVRLHSVSMLLLARAPLAFKPIQAQLCMYVDLCEICGRVAPTESNLSPPPPRLHRSRALD